MKLHYYNNSTLLKGITLQEGQFHAGFIDACLVDDRRQRKIKLAIWYPTLANMQPIFYQKTFGGMAAENSEIVAGKFPLLIFSHGSAGHRFNQYFLAEYLACHGYIIIAIEHPGDNYLDNSLSRSMLNLLHRPHDISVTLDRILEGRFKDCIDANKIGFAGHSFGGYTGLVLAGGIPDFKNVASHFHDKHQYIEFNKRILQDERIKCCFLMAPALAEVFSETALKQITDKITVAFSDQDEFLLNDNLHYINYLTSIRKRIHFTAAGHYVYLMCCPDRIKEIDHVSCHDLSIKREYVHPFLKWHMLDFFNGNFYGD